MVVDQNFWAGRRVFLTGHTGFKGAWLSLWLAELGARITGFALPPPSSPSLFSAAKVSHYLTSIEADIRDVERLRLEISMAKPEVVFHLAAQSLVRRSYAQPHDTYSTNVMGTVNVLEAVRDCEAVRAAIIVTSDKCYENRGLTRGYTEEDPLGGHDPYSSSKACAELVADAYRRSFLAEKGVIATARAGNVIGGGDWAEDRLIPDLMRSFAEGRPARIRNPNAVRPWQHVLDPLAGYLLLAQRLYEGGKRYAKAWNFGPVGNTIANVRAIADEVVKSWGPNARYASDPGAHPHEAEVLTINPEHACSELGWKPHLALADSIEWTSSWYRQYYAGKLAHSLTIAQINRFMKAHCH